MARKRIKFRAPRRWTTFQKCMGVKLKGRHFGTRRAGRIAFKEAARKCKKLVELEKIRRFKI